MDIPTAEVWLAERGSQLGVISRRIHDTEVADLVHGNELLAGSHSRYDPDRLREHPDYTIDRVGTALVGVGPWEGWDGPQELAGFGCWAGLLVLDALIANQDRHHENWGALVSRADGSKALAPSFDHGSSLGFNVQPEQAAGILFDDRVGAWASRGRSTHFKDRPGLVVLAGAALEAAGEASREYWLDRVAALDLGSFRDAVSELPRERMSDPSRNFACAILATNRGRLLDDRR
jgi:hypothetical protein